MPQISFEKRKKGAREKNKKVKRKFLTLGIFLLG